MGVFRFKRFQVNHSQSSMKVGVDAVLIGVWAGKGDFGKILDVGTGCGIISLIMAQRFPKAEITGVDIDQPSVVESSHNFENSPWKERLLAIKEEFPYDTISRGEKYDLIVSNPPFFNSGISNPATPREKARHQDLLSVFSLISCCKYLLNPKGRLSIIYPFEMREKVIEKAIEEDLEIIRECRIRDNLNRPEKRVMMEFQLFRNNDADTWQIENLILHKDGQPTDEYRELCKEFYLKF